MPESVKFFPPKQSLASTGKIMMGGGAAGLAGAALYHHDRNGPLGLAGIGIGTAGTALFLLMVAISVGSVPPVLWVTVEGIFIPLGKGRRLFRWGDPVTVELDRITHDVMLFGRADNSGSTYITDGDEQAASRIPKFVLTDPAFRAALVRWAPRAHPLLAYLPKAG